jgi:hypothetical protein
MHVNVIAKRTIEVDGKLDDWKDIPPQTVIAGDAKPSLTESAWFPFQKFDETVSRGFGSGYLAYDEHFFYFAAKIADDTPDDGMVRFEKRDDDEYFYPATSLGYDDRDKNKPGANDKRTYTWPPDVRRYSYRKNPELPSGNFPNHDNVQIAFNVLPPEQKSRYINPPGTMPGYIAYPDTDYEYALNPVAEKYGGGTEIWRLRSPGMPDKNFYPRQGASPKDGPVRGGKLVITRDGNTRSWKPPSPGPSSPTSRQGSTPASRSSSPSESTTTAGRAWNCPASAASRRSTRRFTPTGSSTGRTNWSLRLRSESPSCSRGCVLSLGLKWFAAFV